MQKIVCVHLLNDYSGSPLVLSTVAKSLVKKGMNVEIITSGNGSGFLSGLEGVRYRFFSYRFFDNKVLRLLMLLWSQAVLFFKIIQYVREDVVIYVNTLLPFGAALAGRLLGKRVVYHLHETTVNPPVLKRFLKTVAANCATEAVYVSRFLMEAEPLKGVSSSVIYNCLSADFTEKAGQFLRHPVKTDPFTILMLCSLKEYKGVNEFVKLAGALPACCFVLVLNSTRADIHAFFKGMDLPENLVIFPSQSDVHSFYREAHLVLNLSHPEKWVETFGMTLLEAMSYGLPVIAPPVGGPAELVEDGFNGYKIDQRLLSVLTGKLQEIAGNPELYRKLSDNALQFSKRFTITRFSDRIMEVAGFVNA